MGTTRSLHGLKDSGWSRTSAGRWNFARPLCGADEVRTALELREYLVGVRSDGSSGLPMAIDGSDSPACRRGLSADFNAFDCGHRWIRTLLGNRRYPDGPGLEHVGYWSGIRHHPGPERVCRLAC